MSSPTLSSLNATGNALEERFKELFEDARSPEFIALVAQLHAWMKDCVAQGRYLPAGSPERRTIQGQVDYWTSRLLRAGHTFEDIDRIAAFDPTAGHVLPHERFPYHGLLAVTEAGSGLFFGREEQTQEFAKDVEERHALLIHSESGGGKSSVAMAGVLPELRRRHPEWLVLPRVTPGMHPADALCAALAALLTTPADVGGRLDAAGVHAALAGRTLLVYVDQLEELLTMCADVHQQAEFSELLAALAQARDLRLLATMRVDHYDRLAHSAECHPLFTLFSQAGSVKMLLPMSLAQIRSVIQKPAETVGLRFVPASIVETLASDSVATPSGLPLLQFALQRLWKERPTRDGEPLDLITEETYAKLPTLPTALSSVAERYFDSMAQQGLAEACKRLMLELTVIDERLEIPLRRRRTERELISVLVSAGLAGDEQARKLIDGFVSERLIVRTGHGEGRQIEVAHEALFRNWELFSKWIRSDEVRTTLREARQIARDALLWEQGTRSPDLLKLRGAPLENAMGHRRAHWLDPQAAAYVDACNAAAQLQAQRDTQAVEALQKAQKGEKRARLMLVVGGLVGVAVLLTALYRWNDAKQKDEADAALREQQNIAAVTLAQEKAIGAANTVTSLVRNLKPLDALDLAHTLHQRVGSPESLAHAIDRLAGGVLIGQRGSGGAYFTASGQAAVLLVRNAQDEVEFASIVPLVNGGASWVPVKLILDRRPQEALAALEVGPRIEGPPDKDERLVVASFVRLGTGIAAPQGNAREWTRMVVFRIANGNSETQRIAEHAYPKGTTQSSDIVFDNSGLRTAVAVWQGTGPLFIASDVLRWSANGTHLDQKVSPRGSAPAVTAVAFGGPYGNRIVSGRSDGRIDCGLGGRPRDGADGSPVVSLRVAELRHAGTSLTKYVALHETNSFSVGDCGNGTAVTLEQRSRSRPQSLALHLVGDGGMAMLTYTLRGKLNCRLVTGKGLGDTCWGQGLDTDQALPVLDERLKLAGYRALPDGAEPLMTFFDANIASQDGRAKAAAGLPTARAPTPDNPNPVAASPNGNHAIAIGSVQSSLSVLRRDVGAQSDQRLAVAYPERVAINDRGEAIVLAEARGNSEPYALSWFRPDGGPGGIEPMGFKATCMKMSPDGTRVLVAGERWDIKVMALERNVAHVFLEGSNRRGAGVSACAIGDGDGAAMVLASRNGDILRYTAGGWKSVSELVAFRLSTAALDVSIDSGSRFVAVIGERLAANCQNGMDGHPLRIWDLKSKRPDLPVASTCLPSLVQAIGTMQFIDNRWVLPVYELRDGLLARFDYPCLACEDVGGSDAIKTRLNDAAKRFEVKVLPPARSEDLYGFKP